MNRHHPESGSPRCARMLHRVAVSAIGVVLAVFSAGTALADYVITGYSGKVIYTKSYWIQGSTLFLSEDNATVNTYEVESVTPRNLSPEEKEAREAVMKIFSGEVGRFLEREKVIADTQAKNVASISGKAAALDVRDMTRKEKKEFTAGLKGIERSLEELQSAWTQALIPDFSLIIVRDIKLLQLTSLEASIEMTIRYIGSGDPTYREYAKAHMAQYGSFEESLRQRLPWK